MIQWMLAIWSLVPLPFLNPAFTSRSSWFTYCWSLTWRILSITLLDAKWVQLSSSLSFLWHCPSLGLEWKLTFSSPFYVFLDAFLSVQLRNCFFFWAPCHLLSTPWEHPGRHVWLSRSSPGQVLVGRHGEAARQDGLAGDSASFCSLLRAWEEDGDSDGRNWLWLLC